MGMGGPEHGNGWSRAWEWVIQSMGMGDPEQGNQ